MTPEPKPLGAMARVRRFGVAGVVGFACDAAVLTVLVQHLGWNAYLARVLSFLVAVAVTWWINRSFTFTDRNATGSGGRLNFLSYLAAQSAGGLANLAIFSLLARTWPALLNAVVVPLAIASLAAAILNFLLLDRWVFRHGGLR